MKDHEKAQLYNEMRDLAIKYANAQQLRARIIMLLAPHLPKDEPWKVITHHAHLDPTDVTHHTLEIPSVPGNLIVKSWCVEQNHYELGEEYGLKIQHVAGCNKRELSIIGEVQVPPEITLEFIK